MVRCKCSWTAFAFPSWRCGISCGMVWCFCVFLRCLVYINMSKYRMSKISWRMLTHARNRHKLLGGCMQWMWNIKFANNLQSLQFQVPSVLWKLALIESCCWHAGGLLGRIRLPNVLRQPIFCKDWSTALSHSFMGAHHLWWSHQFRNRHLLVRFFFDGQIIVLRDLESTLPILQESPVKKHCDS